MKRFVLLCLAALCAPLLFAQVQISGPTMVIGGTVGSPGGSTGSLQYNGSGSFSGATITTDGNNLNAPSGNIMGYTLGGARYAVNAQTGGGANGIVNAIAYGQTIVADPSYAVHTTANMTQGSTSITVASAAGIVVGQYVSGNVPQLTTVASVSGTTVTLSASALTTNSAAPINFFEFPYSTRGVYNVPPNSNVAFVDNMMGRDIRLARDAPQDPFTGAQDFNYRGCYATKAQGWNTTTSNGGAGWNSACFVLSSWFAMPGTNYGTSNGTHGASNWAVSTTHNVGQLVSTRGISEMVGGVSSKAGVGDAPLGYYYYNSYLGSVAGADEGQGGMFTQGGEANTAYSGTVSTGGGGTGATSLSITCATDCAAIPNLYSGGPGDGRYMVDKTGGLAFKMISRTAPSGQIPGYFTTDTSASVSTFWGTISTDVVTPPGVNSSGIPFADGTTAMTFSVAAGTINSIASPGPPAIGDLVCFSWPQHEQATITNVTGSGPWSVTVPLRLPHPAGSWMISNGACGSFANFTANDVAANATFPATTLHYPIDVIGSINATTWLYVYFATSAVNVNAPQAFPLGNITFPSAQAGSTMQNLGGTVTLTSSTINISSSPQYYYQPSIQIVNATNVNYNGACTNTLPDYAGRLTCTQASSIGQAATTGFTLALGGSSGYGNTDGFLWPGAEVLDILDYNQTNCAATSAKNAPCFDSKNIKIEPNGAAWANNDSVEEPHHYAKQIRMRKDLYYNYSPYQMQGDGGYLIGLTGPGVCCGMPTNVTQNWAALSIGNNNLGSLYQYHGGVLPAPGGINLGSGPSNTGVGYLYGLFQQLAPEPAQAGTVLYTGCPASPWGCTDRFYKYQIWAGTGTNNVAGGPTNTANWITYSPFNNEITFGNGTNPIVWNGEMNGTTNRDVLKFAAMATPTVTVAPSITGGTLAAGSYCYYIIARNTGTFTPQPSEVCGSVASGTTGSVKLTWTRISGATSYYVCGRTTGAEAQELNLGGVDSTQWVDTGGATPSGSCNFATTAENGYVDQAGQVGMNSLGTSFETVLKAAASLGASNTLTLPSATGTLALNTPCVASGVSHAAGLAPDPGSSAGTTRFLREDCTWAAAPTSATTTKAWNAYYTQSNAGGTTSIISSMVFGEAATLTRFIISDASGATCTVQPVAEIQDASNSNASITTLTIPNVTSPVDSGVLSIPITSGHNLRLHWSNQGTCTAYPSIINFTIEYAN